MPSDPRRTGAETGHPNVVLALATLGALGVGWLLFSRAGTSGPARIVTVLPAPSATAATGSSGAGVAPPAAVAAVDDGLLQIVNPNLLDLQLLSGGKTAVAVGTEGTVLRSDDDGKTFTKVPTGTREYLTQALVERDQKSVLIVGSGGMLLRSEDGVHTLSRVDLADGRVLSHIAQSPATGHLVIVGELGRVIASSDGGRHFSSENAGTLAYLMELVTTRGPRGRFIAAGESGALLIRESNGQWHASRAAGDKFVTALTVLRSGTVLVGLQDGRILRSESEGDHFSVVHHGQTDHYAFAFDGPETARGPVVVRARKEPFLLSTDDGRGFTRLGANTQGKSVALTWLPGTGYVGIDGTGGTVFSDLDGRKWQFTETRALARATKVLRNPSTGTLLAVGSSGYLGRSTDGGRSFDSIHPDLGALIRASAWDPKTDTLVAVGLESTVVRSVNGGRSYQRRTLKLEPGDELSALAFEPQTSTFLAGTTEGDIYRAGDSRLSFTRGASIAKPVLQLLALGESKVLAVGSGDGVLLSRSAGTKFAEPTGNVKAVLRQVIRLGETQVLVAVGDDAQILRSADLGETFAQTAAPDSVTATLRGLWFEGKAKRLWVVGDKGVMLLSSDMGKSFARVLVPTEENLFVVGGSFDGSPIFVGGNAGTLLRTDDQGRTFATLDTGSRQPVRAIEPDTGTGEFVIGGVGGLLMRTVGRREPKRIAGRFEGRFDRLMYHPPSGATLILGDRLMRLENPLAENGK